MRKIMYFFAAAIICGFTGDASAFGTKELDTEKTAVNLHREADRGKYKIITTKELKDWIDQKKDMLIVDTMPYDKSYRKHHIPGAVNIELPIPEMTTLDEKTKETFLGTLGSAKDRTIVFYCGFTTCTRSHNGALWAVKLGYTNVYRQPGGINAWLDADYPVEK